MGAHATRKTARPGIQQRVHHFALSGAQMLVTVFGPKPGLGQRQVHHGGRLLAGEPDLRHKPHDPIRHIQRAVLRLRQRRVVRLALLQQLQFQLLDEGELLEMWFRSRRYQLFALRISVLSNYYRPIFEKR